MNKRVSLPVNQVVCGDCVEVMKDFPDESIDLVIVDPPYISKTFNLANWRQDISFQKEWIAQVYRVIKKHGTCYVFWNVFKIDVMKSMLEQQKFDLRNIIVCHHPNIVGKSFIGDKYAYRLSWEPIFYVSKGTPRYSIRNRFQEFSKNSFDVWKITYPQSNFKKDPKLHPAQKPIKVMERIILASSNEDELILDPFVGSGTSCVASKKLGRGWIGIDINPEYVEMAKKRLMRECNQKLAKFMEVSN